MSARGSGSVTAADIIVLVNWIFKGIGEPEPCEAAGDLNCDGVPTAADVITEVNREPVENLSDYRRAMREVEEGGLVVLYVINPPSRTGGDSISRYVTLRMQEQE